MGLLKVSQENRGKEEPALQAPIKQRQNTGRAESTVHELLKAMTFAWWNLGSQAGRLLSFGVFLALEFLPVCAVALAKGNSQVCPPITYLPILISLETASAQHLLIPIFN